jgi:trans-aconitate methyltransferase
MKWDPEDYAVHSDGQLVWARDLMARMKLSGGESILDIGCGDGKVTAELARAVPRGVVVGVDSSSEFILFAREHYPARTHPNLKFEECDARGLAYSRMFDIAFSNAALHWLDDHRAFLAGLARSLKPGGQMTISCGGAGNAEEIASAMDDVVRRPKWREWFADFKFPWFFYSTSDYARWLPEAGFTARRLELIDRDMTRKGKDGLVSWLRTTWMPYTHRLPEDLRPEFLSAAADEYLRRHPLDEDGLAHVPMVRLEVDAYLSAA